METTCFSTRLRNITSIIFSIHYYTFFHIFNVIILKEIIFIFLHLLYPFQIVLQNKQQYILVMNIQFSTWNFILGGTISWRNSILSFLCTTEARFAYDTWQTKDDLVYLKMHNNRYICFTSISLSPVLWLSLVRYIMNSSVA